MKSATSNSLAAAGVRKTDTVHRAADLPEKERACRECGCTDQQGCDGGCAWVETDLCSTCISKSVAFWMGCRYELVELLELLKPSHVPAVATVCDVIEERLATIDQEATAALAESDEPPPNPRHRGGYSGPARDGFGKGVRTADAMGGES